MPVRILTIKTVHGPWLVGSGFYIWLTFQVVSSSVCSLGVLTVRGRLALPPGGHRNNMYTCCRDDESQ